MRLTRKTASDDLTSFRERHGYTLEKLSDKTGVSKSTLIAIEAGRGNIQAKTIFKLNQFIIKVEPCTEAM